MAIVVTHPFVNPHPDGPDLTLTKPSDWNAGHTVTGAAPLASPALTGTPTVPTAAPGTNNTQAASTAYVDQTKVVTLGGYSSAAPSASLVLASMKAPYAFTLPANLSTSQAVAGVAATGSTVFNVTKNGASIGTLTWAPAGTVPAFATSGGLSQSFAIGDIMKIVAASAPDATLADITITLLGTRT